MTSFDPDQVRGFFPALQVHPEYGQPIFLDGPGGTQVPQQVLDAMTGYLGRYNGNLFNSPFYTVQKTQNVTNMARQIVADFVNAKPENIVFGASTSALTSMMSRVIGQGWQACDEIIVTDIDHYSNVSFWAQTAQERGVKVHYVPLKKEDCTLDYTRYEALINERTKFVAFSLASNVAGSVTDAQRMMKAAKDVGAMTYVDAVHYAVHFLPDVQALDCDFLACSCYKFFGPHYSFIFGKSQHLEGMTPYKVEPSPDKAPDRWEPGTKSFENLSGIIEVIKYLASPGEGADLRAQLENAYEKVFAYEMTLTEAFLSRAKEIEKLRIYGITNISRIHERTPTFAIRLDGMSPLDLVEMLAKSNISTGAGNFYAPGVTKSLGLEDKGGVVRVGFVHYNTHEELNRLFDVLSSL